MKQAWVLVVGTIVGIAALVSLVFLFESVEVKRAKTFDPLHEEARRETFEQSRAYREGIAQDLQSMQIEYARSTPDQKETIESVVLDRYAGAPMDAFSVSQQAFLSEIRRKRGLSQ